MVIIHHEDLMEHDHWPDHPESPYRLRSIRKRLMQEGLWQNVEAPPTLQDEDLLRVHSTDLVQQIRKGGNMPLDADTMLKDHTFDLAKLSAEVTAEAARRASRGEMAFALTRPPGHHASACKAGGFCYFNNAAVAACRLGLRTAIVDLDAHHGDGTESIFYQRDDVLFISLHQFDQYPGTGSVDCQGEGDGLGYNVNIPMPRGAGNVAYTQAFDQVAMPIMKQFAPDLLIVSLGVDAHYSDTMSSLSLNTPGYLSLCRRLMDFMDNRDVAFILEGGYHLRSTAEVVAGVISAFRGEGVYHEYAEEIEEPSAVESILMARKEHGKHWTL